MEIQDVEFNNNGKIHDEHSFSPIPKHSKHLLLHTILFYFILFIYFIYCICLLLLNLFVFCYSKIKIKE